MGSTLKQISDIFVTAEYLYIKIKYKNESKLVGASDDFNNP
jgi:hypothetical protein